MKVMKRTTLLFALTVLALVPRLHAAGPSPPAAPSFASVRVADFAWMAGIWQGEMGGDFIEEQWSDPAGGVLMGMFRWAQGGRDGQIAMYELMSIEPGSEGPVLWLRHFGPRLVAREDKEGAGAFHLVSYKQGAATFDNRDPADPARLTYRREGEDRLVVVLSKVKDGKPVDTEFSFYRK
jgi:hypothetical protein